MISNNSIQTENTTPYASLEEIIAKKNEIGSEAAKSRDRITLLWKELSSPQPVSNKGELISSLISNSITAFDAFMLVRKLAKRFGNPFKRRK